MASSVIGALRVMLGLDTAEFEAGTTRAARQSQRLERELRKTGRNLQRTGRNLTLALTAPLAAFGVSSFAAASDAAELQSAFDQTFGEMSGEMNRWAEETGDAMGRSTQAMQELANTFGIFFNQAAPTREEAARMSQTFAELAQDLASFYNVAEEDALGKLRSGLAGEAEPLRDFGVFLSAAAVEARALEMGLADASGEISEQDKILARYNLILEATTNAQGDVARTAEGTANRMRTARAAFEELQVSIGKILLPVFTPLIEAFGKAVNFLSQLPPGAQGVIVALAGIAAAAGPVLFVFGSILANFGALKVAFLAASPWLAGFAVAGLVIYENWDKIAPALEDVARGMGLVEEATPGVVDGLERQKSEWERLGESLVAFNDRMNEFNDFYHAVLREMHDAGVEGRAELSRLFHSFVDTMNGAGARIISWLSDLASRMVEMGRNIVQGLVRGIRQAASSFRDAVVGVVSDGVARAREFLGINSPSLLFMEIGGYMMEGLALGIEEKKGLVTKGIEDLAKTAEKQTRDIGASFESMAETALGAFDQLLRGIRSGGVTDILGGLLGALQQFGVFGGTGSGAGGGLLGATKIGSGLLGGLFGGGKKPLPKFASGGAMRLGGYSGVDTNVLALNGSPIARVSSGETMQISPANDRGGQVVHNHYTLPSDEFWRRVDGRADGRIGEATPGIVKTATGETFNRMGRARNKALA